MSNYTLVDTPQKLEAMVNAIASNNKILAVDCETLGLHARKDKLRLIQINDKENTYLVDCFGFGNYQQLKKLGDVLSNKSTKTIFHNYKFDAQFLLKYLNIRVGTVFDTYIADVLMDFQAGHKLSNISLRYLNVNLDKTEQRSDWSGELTQSQLQYFFQ